MATVLQPSWGLIATVRGRFREFEGTLEAAEDLADSRCYGSVNVASIDTGDRTATRTCAPRTTSVLRRQKRLAAGGVLVGEEVKLRIDVSAVRDESA